MGFCVRVQFTCIIHLQSTFYPSFSFQSPSIPYSLTTHPSFIHPPSMRWIIARRSSHLYSRLATTTTPLMKATYLTTSPMKTPLLTPLSKPPPTTPPMPLLTLLKHPQPRHGVAWRPKRLVSKSMTSLVGGVVLLWCYVVVMVVLL